MSSISAISSLAPQTAPLVSMLQQQGTAKAVSSARDADGDHDGTRPGQVDSMDFGKGLLIDRRA